MSRTNFWSKLFGSQQVTRPSRKNRMLQSAKSPSKRLTRQLFVEGLEDRLCLSGSWATEAPLPTPRLGLDMAADPASGLIYAVSGQVGVCPDSTAAEVYDPAQNSWQSLPPTQSPHEMGGAAVVDGILYVIGGQFSCGFGTIGDTVEAYDPGTHLWTSRAPLPEPASSFGVGVVDGKIYVVGGGNYSGYLAHTYVYDPLHDSWSNEAPYPGTVSGQMAGVIDGIIYVAGGSSPSAQVTDLKAFDPATHTWTDKADMPNPRAAGASGVVAGQLYVLGGVPGNPYTATMDAYDPASDTWTTQPAMPTARGYLAAAAVNGVLYAMGGISAYTNPPSLVAANEAFSPLQPSFASVVGGSFTYDGLPHGATSSSVTGSGGLNTTADSFIYSGTGATSYGPTSTPPTDAGTYTVIATYNGDATHTGSTSAPADITISKASLTATGHTENSINIAKNGNLVFMLSDVTGIRAGDGTVSDLFNGATFQLRIGGGNGALYSVSSTAIVLSNGSIQISWQMTQELYSDLHALLGSATPANKTPVDFFLSGTSNDGNYSLTADALSRIFQQGKVNFT